MKAEYETASQKFMFRLTPTEVKRLREAAAREGRSVSNYVRWKLLYADRQSKIRI